MKKFTDADLAKIALRCCAITGEPTSLEEVKQSTKELEKDSLAKRLAMLFSEIQVDDMFPPVGFQFPIMKALVKALRLGIQVGLLQRLEEV